MDEKTLLAITELANKLGTTAEYLWSVLLKQAPISAFQSVISLVLCATFYLFLLKLVVTKTKSQGDEYAEWAEEGAFFAWFAVVVASFGMMLVVESSLTNFITAVFNPEYWALNKILRN